MTPTLRRLSLIAGLLSLAGLVSLFVAYGLWQRGAIQAWLLQKAETAVVRLYHDKLEGKIPIEVEKVEYQKNWREILVGRIEPVSITLKKDDVRIHLSGPLHFPALNWETAKQLYRKIKDLPLEHGRGDLTLEYDPVIRFESSSQNRLLDPLQTHLSLTLSGELNDLQSASLSFSNLPQNPHWKWASVGIDLEQPLLQIDWKESRDSEKSLSPLKAQFTAKSVAHGDTLRVTAPKLSAQIPLSLSPFQLGSVADLNWQAKNGEALLGDRYFALSEPPLHGQAQIREGSSLDLALGQTKGKQLHLQLRPRTRTRTRPNSLDDQAEYKIRLDPLALQEVIPSFLKATANAGAPFTNLAFLQNVKFKDGHLSASVEGTIPLQKKAGNSRIPDFSRILSGGKIEEANLALSQASLLWPERQLAIKNLNLKIPYLAHQGFEGELSVSRFGYRKLRGRLLPTRISFEERGATSLFRIGEKGSRIPLDVDGLVLRIESIGGSAQLSPFQYHLDTRISLEPTPLEQLALPLCLEKPGSRILPAKVRIDLPKIDLTSGDIDLTGFIRADLFGGSIQIDEMGVFDFLSPVPEVDFNAELEGIDLHELGNWLNFGEMDGTLSAFAKDVVFQSWLPTQYNFEVKVKPLHRSKVVFSPAAMKNFARLFAGEGIEHLPSYAEWLAFGWPSRFLGGYDIDYAGVKIRSEDGYIRLETLDPLYEGETESSRRKHFILYGKRFKIPLKSSRYPLILDAPAMGDYVHQMIGVIENLAKKKKGETANEASNEVQSSENDRPEANSLPASCIPSELSHL
jgi:hypothetical protein